MTTQPPSQPRTETPMERLERAVPSIHRQYAVAKRRGYNQAVRRIRDLAPYARDPEQVGQLADLLAAIGPDMPPPLLASTAQRVSAMPDPTMPPYAPVGQDFLADLDEPQYDLVERPGKALTHRLTCIRCRGSRRDGNALCRRCRWSPRRAWRLWRNR